MPVEIGTPEVLKNPDTEPEAAHLRNVLRRLRVAGEHSIPPELLLVIDNALARPRTNGAVIDQLTQANGDLQSEILDLQGQLRRRDES